MGIKRFLFFLLLLPLSVFSQYIPEYPENSGIYSFIDEMSSRKILIYNTTIKPLSKIQIAKLLKDVEEVADKLNSRQRKELNFYIKAYSLEIGILEMNTVNSKTQLNSNPISLTYQDSLFSLSIRPIISGYLYINDSNTVQNRFFGASINGYIGKYFSFYANVSDHWETEALARQTYLTQLTGGQYKPAVDRTGGEFSTIRGGTNLSWKWGNIGLVYDRITWGNGYSGNNIFSGRNTPFPQIIFNLKPVKWFEFNYVHGWLDSKIVDSTRSFYNGTDYLRVYREKYIAANMFTFFPFSFLQLSVGNSIIYSNPKAYPGFIIPILFYRSVDENSSFINSNSQLFGTVNIFILKHWNFYSSIYFDEFRLSRVLKSDLYNFNSLKFGFHSAEWPLKNLFLTIEYTRTTPITYKHRMPILSYSTNDYYLGHYLRDNSKDFFCEVLIKPLPKAYISLTYYNAFHFNNYNYINGIIDVAYKSFKDPIYHNQSITGNLSYEIFAGTTFKGSIMYSKITSVDADGRTAAYYLDMFAPRFLQGKHITLIGGLTIAF